MTEYLVEVKVRNNLLLRRMKEAGIGSATELSRQTGIAVASIFSMLNLKLSLYNPQGQLRWQWETIADFLRVMPEEIVPKEVRVKALESNKKVVESSWEDLLTSSPEVRMIESDATTSLGEAINSLNLSPKRKAIYLSYRGILGYPSRTAEELAKRYKVTSSYIHLAVRQVDERLKRKKHLKLLIKDFNHGE